MLDTLPPEIIRAIYGATNDLAAATSLARCSKYFYEIWTAHFRTLSLHDSFAYDERWGSMRYLDSARMLARIQFAKSGITRPKGLETMKSAYRIAGIINRTASELYKELKDLHTDARWTRWLQYVLLKSLHLLWGKSLVGATPGLDRKRFGSFCAYLLQPRWQEFGFPSMQGFLGARAPAKEPPVKKLLDLCCSIRRRKNLDTDYNPPVEISGSCESVGWVDPAEYENPPDEFYDDMDMDDGFYVDLDNMFDSSEDESENED